MTTDTQEKLKSDIAVLQTAWLRTHEAIEKLAGRVAAFEKAQKQAEPPTVTDHELAEWDSCTPGGKFHRAAAEIRYLRAELARLREDYQALKDSYNEGSKLAHDYCHEFKVGRLGHSVIAEAILDARRLREGLEVQEGDVVDSTLPEVIESGANNIGYIQRMAREIQRHRALVTK